MTTSFLPGFLQKMVAACALAGNLLAFGQTVQQAPSGLKGFDCDTPLTAEQAADFKQAGYSFCLRYLSLTDYQYAEDLSASEVWIILDAGLALSAVQHVPDTGWAPTASLGNVYGTNAAANADSIGLPSGMNLWCDLESVAAHTLPDSVIAYCNAWYDAVYAGGYIPGLYVGPDCVLDKDYLYNFLKFNHYWKSASEISDVPNRGYQMLQQEVNLEFFGVGIDTDVTQNDALGGTVLWLKL